MWDWDFSVWSTYNPIGFGLAIWGLGFLSIVFFLLGTWEAFKRNPLLALLGLIFFPLFLIWVVIEVLVLLEKKRRSDKEDKDFDTRLDWLKDKLKPDKLTPRESLEAIEDRMEARGKSSGWMQGKREKLRALIEENESSDRAKEDIRNQKCGFSRMDIQRVLDTFVTEGYAVQGHMFTFFLSKRENIFVQGALLTDNNELCVLSISSKHSLTNPELLTTNKFKKLISIGWEIPEVENNFSCVVTVRDILDYKVAELLFESLKVFNLNDSEIDCSYEIVYLI